MRLNQIKDLSLITPEAFHTLLSSALLERPSINKLRFYGNGDPTLHSHFDQIIEVALQEKDLKIEVVTSGTTLEQRKIVFALNKVTERIVKLDAGSEKIFKRLNSPLARAALSKLMTGTAFLNDHVLLTTFVQGEFSNATNQDIEDWLEVVGILKPKQIILTTSRDNPTTPGIKPCSEDQLDMIVSKVDRRIQLRPQVILNWQDDD
jgi:wyosine [tRNA(Phe)-imidazoG37] synthetase (radical SAM superfamily)